MHSPSERKRTTTKMIGESPAMRALYAIVARVAPTDVTVVVRGESGSGKELVARALHETSPRASKPFVPINCAAIPDGLIESELFGHERGAFTGAFERKLGTIEIVGEGTLFLDEIAELGLATQAKLLRVLQERTFERVGGTRSISAAFRLVVATNVDLRLAVDEGRFRDDLFHRINVVALTVPPLRDRREDIPALAEHFAASHRSSKGRPTRVSPAAIASLLRYDWPGNVRELRNAIEHAAILGASDTIEPESLPAHVVERAAEAPSLEGGYRAAVEEAKRRIVLESIVESGGDLAEAARRLRLDSAYLRRLVRRFGLDGAVDALRRP